MVNKKIVKYVLIIPRWMSLVIFDIIIWVKASPFGPEISNHVWSSLVAIDCPRVKLSFGGSR